MSRDCTRCGGFGEYVYAADSSGGAAYASCPDCDGYGILPDDKGQSRKGSLVETCASTAIGFVVSLGLISLVLPAFGYHSTPAHNFWITVIFTVASVVRGYVVRRVFEGLR
jgi:hypothetical protein